MTGNFDVIGRVDLTGSFDVIGNLSVDVIESRPLPVTRKPWPLTHDRDPHPPLELCRFNI